MLKKPAYIFVLLLVIILINPTLMLGQEQRITIKGIVLDSAGVGVPSASVYVVGGVVGVSTDDDGRFMLHLSERDSVTIRVSCVGYKPIEVKLQNLRGRSVEGVSLVLYPSEEIIEGVIVKPSQRRIGNIERIGIDGLKSIPNTLGGFEAIMKLLPGVSSSNELSSQYNVRGGNFDENLVYVNDVEVFRPFLIRSAQQEGLSFINPDMVGSIEFSSGGFSAEFGDKMSSVLNVRYREPKVFGVRVGAGLLGSSATVEGVLPDKASNYIMGFRYKTSKYMLNTLETKGDYYPSFFDWQGLINVSLGNRISLGFLGNIALNQYQFKPTVRETRFGVFNNTLQLKVYYDGQERDAYLSSLGAISATYRISSSFLLKLITSAYYSRERETYDLLGQYFLNELDNSMGSRTYGDSLINVGIGGFLDHARNNVNLYIQSAEFIGDYRHFKNRLKWGAQVQRELIDDELSEWGAVDSSGFAIPYNGVQVGLSNSLQARGNIQSFRSSGFAQAEHTFSISNWELTTNAGIRASRWNYNNELLVSPRLSINFKNTDVRMLEYHISAGYYYQPPFYRELRLTNGILNGNIRSQISFHLVGGTEYFFMAWDRPFRLSLELYNKWMSRLIPYSIDNVRIRYSGQNLAKGFARGVDLKVNGELVPGAESWLSISVMRTKEDNLYDYYVNSKGEIIYPGYYYRPTDQTFNIALFLQDYLPGDKNFRVNLSGVYGSGLPMTANDPARVGSIFRMPAYRRIDVGFSKYFIDNLVSSTEKFGINSLSLSLEIFNLFNFNNTVSYLWVQTVGNQDGESYHFAVPNYLTTRRVNVRIQLTF